MTIIHTQMPSTDHGHAGLAGETRSEWTKFRSVRSTWICLFIILLAGIGLSVLLTFIQAARWSHSSLQERATFDPVAFSQSGHFISQLVVGILGAMIITSEYSTGLIRTTLATVPKRYTVMAAKKIVIAIVILVIGEVTAFASFFAAQIILTAHGGTELPAGASIVTQVKSASIPVVTIMSPGVLQAVVLSGVYLVLLSILALGLGFIIRSTAGAISIYVGILLVLPIILNFFPSGFKNSVEPYMPSNLGIAMVVTTTRSTDWAGVLLTPWVAVLVLALYAAVFLLVGLWFLQRRDA